MLLLGASCIGAGLDTSSFEIGADVSGAFAPLHDGDTIPIQRGPQGGVHIALAASRFPTYFDAGERTGLLVVLPSATVAGDRDVLLRAELPGARDERIVRLTAP